MYHITSNKKLHLYKTVQLAELQALQKQHETNPHDLFWAYRALFFESIPMPKNATDQVFWKKLTKPQQIVYALGIFIEQTNNGGIWQFFFNKTEYACAVGEAFETFSNMNRFNTHYTRCFNDLAVILESGEFFEICDIWNDTAFSFEQRWTVFKKAERHIPHHTEFEEYFYSEEGKDRLYNDLINPYIEQNLGAMLVVEGATTVKAIDKKGAIPHFTDYLTQHYGVAPSEVSIYYTASVTIDNTATKLFLMRFAMPDGYESLGITGYFTHHFADVDWADVKGMHQRNHKQELINIYYGWYLIDKYDRENPNKPKFDAADWQLCLAKLQDLKNSQIPVNVQFKDALFYENQWHYAYTGDLFYNKKSLEVFPPDFPDVDVLSVYDKRVSEYRGELNRLFSTLHIEKPGFGREDPTPSLNTKCFWARWIGRSNKLVKDNPWGF
ncbi:MAG: hypothetical protein RLZZ292_2947 [Bacteroidota bacterium]|jgi:hypothetical protein